MAEAEGDENKTALLLFDVLLHCMSAPLMFAKQFARRLCLVEVIKWSAITVTVANGTLMPRGDALTAEGQAAHKAVACGTLAPLIGLLAADNDRQPD